MDYEYNTHVIKKMNMPFTITFVKGKFVDSEKEAYKDIVTEIESYLDGIERKFSIFKEDSIVSRHNELINNFNEEFLYEEYQEVFVRCQQAKTKTNGYFDSFFSGKYNPTGFVKGWAIEKAFFKYLEPLIKHNIVEAVAINGAGDMQLGTKEDSNFVWNVGIENPDNNKEIIAKYSLQNGAIATSGFSKKSEHIKSKSNIDNIQVTVVGEYLSDIDVFATTGIAMPSKEWNNFVIENRLMGILVNKENRIIAFEGGKINEIKRS
ncbi:FAD:protein FMN transferase [Gemella sanguinis]|uniref:FAD:protein FMN transferase n=1 Tax=Gemella sanguinis TaxID=84135 RepID=UPI000A6FD0E0|nr:FAD:protein FMN transferase [Gemella sanguinis]